MKLNWRGKRFPGKDRRAGFSLVELMVAIAVITVLSGIAIPNILRFRENARMRTAVSGMLSLFRLAQTEAVKRNNHTCLIFDAATSTTTVFLDDGSGGGMARNCVLDGSEPTLRTLVLPPGTFMPGSTINFPGASVGFTPHGLPAKGLFGSIQIHPTSDARIAYRINMSIAGHTRIATSTDGGLHFF